MSVGQQTSFDYKLLVITDEPFKACLPEYLGNTRIEVIDYNEISEAPSLSEVPLFIDINLHDHSKVIAVKAKLPSGARKHCTFVAVDPHCHLSQVRAYALGASELVTRPPDIHAIIEHLDRHFGPKPNEDLAPSADEMDILRRPGGPSVIVAANALGQLFSAMVDGGEIDIGSVTSAGEQIIDTISELGLSEWLSMVRTYHEGTFQHCLVVTGVLTSFGHRLGMRRSDIQTLVMAGLLHDIGKVRISTEILDKPGKLTSDEFTLVKWHPIFAHERLSANAVIPANVLDAVRHHHEYLNGGGYPDGLSGQEVTDLTRIVTVCDIYGALIERRAYKPPMAPPDALDVLRGMATKGMIERGLVRALADCL